MKKLTLVVMLMTLSLFAFNEDAKAGSYGRIHLTGVSITPNEYVFYADQYNSSYNPQECCVTNWWWPAGTSYSFWIPREGNAEIYKHFLVAFEAGQQVWISAIQNNLAEATSPCQLQHMSNTGFFIGNF